MSKTITIKCEIERVVHQNSNFQILGALPVQYHPDIEFNRYGNISIKDPTLLLQLGNVYELELTTVSNDKYGDSYIVRTIPSMEVVDSESLTTEQELEILNEITTHELANSIHKAYPDYVKTVLRGEQDEIDLNKIKGVKDVRHAMITRKINERFKYYHVMMSNKEMDLSMQECKALCIEYGTVNDVNKALKDTPYYALIMVCNRSFYSVDKFIKAYRQDLLGSDQRTEFLMLDVLTRNQYTGSTCMNANEMAEYCNSVDSELIPKLKPVAIQSPLIYYDDNTKNIAIMSTYIAELNISSFVKQTIFNSTKLDWDWQKFTEIKDGTLTEEQSNVLKTFCESNFVILDAPAGSGKTSVLKAVLDMCDEYKYTYTCLAFTGKASSRMSEQTGRPASTIHRATGSVLSANETESKTTLCSDVIVVDEYSMLSVDLMNMVVGSVQNKDTRIFLVGDTQQLPSLSMGRIAKDLLEVDYIPKCTLTKCFRFDEGGASYVSTLTRQGKFYLTDEQCEEDRVTLGKKKDYTFVKSDGTVRQIINEYLDLINKGIKKEDICILSPMNVHEFGATNINNLIQAEINPSTPNETVMTSTQNDTTVILRKGDLIMNTRNDYKALPFEQYKAMYDEWGDSTDITEDDVLHTEIFNGQVGKVMSVDENKLVGDIEGELIVFDKIKCYNLLLAYASNPFKFQGSSCKYIINLVLNKHAKMLNRQLLYTAQTRQEVCLIEIGEIDAMKDAVSQLGDDKRKTMLKDMLLRGVKEC